ncbi:MAG: phosphoglucosamine mutase [Clostridia bacterium]|nr:phosphoglucosamine mutase [Clostridia bacterium]
MVKFGTDGIRGIYGEEITLDLAFKIGLALAKTQRGAQIVVGRDNRPGGRELLASLCGGIRFGGGVASVVGVCTTPCISFLTENGSFDYGVMITASHNPPEYNGIKVVSSGGTKITPETERSIEKMIECPPQITDIGKIKHAAALKEGYVNFLRLVLPKTKLKIVVDCSNGASRNFAKQIFKKDAIFTGQKGGTHINYNCGATHPEHLQKVVIKTGADVGFAFDGDADRIIVATKQRIYDGDNILFLLAKYYKDFRTSIKSIVSTKMSNMGLEEELNKLGIELIRTDVGDKFVVGEMQKRNLVLGGEQAGHIILSEFVNSGDGLLVSLVLLHAIEHFKKSVDELLYFERFPQVERSVVVKNKTQTITSKSVVGYIEQKKQILNGSGRLLVRESGTEPKIRIMVECKDGELAKAIANELDEKIVEVDKLCVE